MINRCGGPREKIKEPAEQSKSVSQHHIDPGLIEGHSHLFLYPYNITDWNTKF